MPTLQQLRQLAILTQAELAEELGVSVTTISLWETGSKRPRASNIRKLAKALGVSPQEVLAAINETSSHQKQS
jgi:transcriptional regulator with XRE-family HTH domain